MRSRPDSLRHEITVVLTLKAAAILVLWALFFSPARRPTVDAHALDGRLLGGAPVEPRDRRPQAR